MAPTSGKVMFDSSQVSGPGTDRVMVDKMITGPGPERGMVFQQGALFEWMSVAENIGFGPSMKGTPKGEIMTLWDAIWKRSA